MEQFHRECERARRSRDPRFDGRFFIAVTTTGVYCRSICPARTANDENVCYFPSAAAAQAAGFRPCLRCRPEASPGTPAWLGTSAVVSRGLRLIGEGALDDASVEVLAERLGVTARHLRRLFLQHLGATPLDVAHTRRVQFAKKLLDETRLGLEDVAFASGFGSVRRFNSEIRRTYRRTPTELRALARRPSAAEPEHYKFRLAYRPPYDWVAMHAFLAAHAVPGVERIDERGYWRTIEIRGVRGTIDVAPDVGDALALQVRIPDPSLLLLVVERVRRVFDLGADPAVIAEHLGADPRLRRALDRHPGIRAPGAWDGFELFVRELIGPWLASRVVARFGTALEDAALFPGPAQLASAQLESVGVSPVRAAAIHAFAAAVLDGSLDLASTDTVATAAALARLPGVEAWRAEYIAMRALGEPDAFPAGDPELRRAAGGDRTRDLVRRARAWRPWRAYAAMLLETPR